MPAAKAGLQEDDKIVAMDGQPVPSIEGMIDRLQVEQEQASGSHRCTRQPDLNFHLTPVLAKTEDPKEERYRLGIHQQRAK